jgi:hypothetical protein
MKFVNLTPHNIVIRFDASNEPVALDSDLVIRSSGRAFITTASESPIDTINNVPCVQIEYGNITDLPSPDGESLFIVAMPTAQFLAAAGRSQDIRYPDTGKPEYCVRTSSGAPFATRRLLQAKIK